MYGTFTTVVSRRGGARGFFTSPCEQESVGATERRARGEVWAAGEDRTCYSGQEVMRTTIQADGTSKEERGRGASLGGRAEGRSVMEGEASRRAERDEARQQEART